MNAIHMMMGLRGTESRIWDAINEVVADELNKFTARTGLEIYSVEIVLADKTCINSKGKEYAVAGVCIEPQLPPKCWGYS